MHDVQTVATDIPVCQVCHAASLGFGVQNWLNGLRSCFSEDSWEPKEHCVRWEV